MTKITVKMVNFHCSDIELVKIIWKKLIFWRKKISKIFDTKGGPLCFEILKAFYYLIRKYFKIQGSPLCAKNSWNFVSSKNKFFQFILTNSISKQWNIVIVIVISVIEIDLEKFEKFETIVRPKWDHRRGLISVSSHFGLTMVSHFLNFSKII